MSQYLVFIEEVDDPGVGRYLATREGEPVMFDELDAAVAVCEIVGGFPVELS